MEQLQLPATAMTFTTALSASRLGASRCAVENVGGRVPYEVIFGQHRVFFKSDLLKLSRLTGFLTSLYKGILHLEGTCHGLARLIHQKGAVRGFGCGETGDSNTNGPAEGLSCLQWVVHRGPTSSSVGI